jgi:hypothetical protein
MLCAPICQPVRVGGLIQILIANIPELSLRQCQLTPIATRLVPSGSSSALEGLINYKEITQKSMKGVANAN